MSKWGWATRIGGYAAAPFTMGLSVPATQYAASEIEKRQAANDGPGGNGMKGFDDDDPLLGPMGALQNSSAANRRTADEFQNTGADALGPALQYLKSLVSDNGSAIMDATRADRGRVIDQYDTARRSIAQFGPRGGGSASAIAEGRMAEGSQLADITSNAKRSAVTELSSLGPQLAMMGMTADQLASADLNTVIQSILGKQGLALQQRGQNFAAMGDVGEAAGSLLGLFLTRDGGAWGKKAPVTQTGMT